MSAEQHKNSGSLKLYRVYRSREFIEPAYMGSVQECFVLTSSENRAKGMAMDKHPSMKDDSLGMTNKDILVEEVGTDKEIVFGGN